MEEKLIGGRGSGGSRNAKSSMTLQDRISSLRPNEDKSSRIQQRRELVMWMSENAEYQENAVNTGEHFISITNNIPWYQNKAGTLFLLGSDNYWHRIGNDLILYRERKLSSAERNRIKKLLEGT